MSSVKYSHQYEKMKRPGKLGYVTHADLLFVVRTRLEDLPAGFLDYDTTYLTPDLKIGHYELPKKGDYLVLFLLSKEDGFIFTTIRRYTPQKFAYYEGLRGKTLTMEYVDEAAK